MKKKLKWVFGALIVVFALLQFTNPARTNPPVVNDLAATNPPPPEITTLLRAACYDCHSHETIWPWYAHVAPASWLVVSDVNAGREHLDFSDWPTDLADIAKKLDRINEELGYREMPPKQYTLMHPAARLTEAQRKLLMDWSDSAAAKLRDERQTN
ncbi:MAG TPA: heme-binding domain-containing protein [Verrucomicrobiae bacterium]